MRVLMHTRPDWRELPGGDFVQLQRWAVWLRELGVAVEVTDAAEPDLRGVDLVHFNNLGRAFALWPALERCYSAGVPTVLTPLYWPPDEYERHGRPGLVGSLIRLLPDGMRDRLKAAARFLRQPDQRRSLLREVWTGSASLARRFLERLDAFAVNSRAEAAALERLLPAPRPIHVVHSGVDAYYWSPDRDLWAREKQISVQGWTFSEQTPPEALADKGTASEAVKPPCRGILCVARFDPQKAQHRLIEALQPLDVPLTLAGPDNPNYPGYRNLCRKLAGPNVTLLPRQRQDRLKELYRGCQVHVLCSWYETTGLTGLEAGCCGARVVMTDRGGTRDYGGEWAWYADPADLHAIRQAVQMALAADRTPDLLSRVQQHFTWERSARALLSVYETVLSARGSLRRAA